MIIERREADRLLQADIRDIPQQTAMQNSVLVQFDFSGFDL
jgi:hypothetical protein